jgi:hypothetical protein
MEGEGSDADVCAIVHREHCSLARWFLQRTPLIYSLIRICEYLNCCMYSRGSC